MKKLKIFLVLLVLFISIGAVSAEGNFTSLQEEIDSSTDSINITQNYTYDNEADYSLNLGVTINKTDFTINGNGYTISGGNLVRIFGIFGNNITILNLNIIDGNMGEKDGGAIFFACSGTLENVTFTGNTARYGGAICALSPLTLNNVTFTGNTGKKGGAICATSPPTLNNVTFTGNTAEEGGAIYSTNTITINNATFTKNTAKEGGAIYSTNTITINNTTFTENSATNNGGAIYSTNTITINNTIFTENSATNYGGAIYSEKTITLNNTLFTKNNAEKGGAIYSTNTITINNATFTKNNAEDGGAIYSEKRAIINNGKFANNNATYGGVVYNKGYLEMIDCQFNNNTAKWGGSIFSTNETAIINSTFRNSKSEYATAIYAQNILCVKNSTFENLYSNETAGAIGIKSFTYVEIDGCNFTNTKSKKNGGAIFIDTGDKKDGITDISNSKFVNSTADYGGALVQLGAEISIENCEFINNSALYGGGAMYLSHLSAEINNTLINENRLSYENFSCGGGIYCDVDTITVENCNFTNNAFQGIYAYDSELTMKNIIFSNNGEAIHGVFIEYDLEEINLGNDTVFLNDTNYDSDVYEIGKKLILINNTINVVNLPSRYDSRDWGWVSSVKDQGYMGACWAFGTCGALESALLKATGIEYDFSENNMQNSMLEYSKYGIIGATEGGSREQGLIYILSWFGVMPNEYDTYDELGKLSPLITGPEKIHIFDAIFANSRKNATDNDAVKKIIMQCGSVTTGYYHNFSCYNEKTFSYYQNTKNRTNHAISLVGWDDNYPASNFLITPPGNGAFILKNSWGTDYGEDGYIYISYYDTSLLNTTFAIGFIIENMENYTANYQTDLGGHLEKEYDSNANYKNTYEAYRSELISAVGTYFEENESYTLEIYVNDELVHNQSGITPFAGYHTVKLTSEIPVSEGDNFTALMRKTMAPFFSDSRQHYMENKSYVESPEGWFDLSTIKKTVSLKVYTKDLNIYTEDLVKIYKNDSQFEANIGIANETVFFKINGRTYARTTDENGIASLDINLRPGNYTIKTQYNELTKENNVEVLSTLIGNDLVKYYRNASQFHVSLIDGAGNPVSGADITMNINGVFYTRTTDENGTATLNINLPPGEYILTAIDPLTGLAMAYKITVLPTLTAEDLNMTYLDNSTYKVKVVDGQGTPVVHEPVKLNINGIIYTRYTNYSGIAELKINLMPGKYIITAEYENAKLSNTIIITEKED